MADRAFQQHEKVGKIEKVDNVVDMPRVDLEVNNVDEVSAPSKVKFEQALERADSKWDHTQRQQVILVADDPGSMKPSPIAELSMSEKRVDRLKPVTIEELIEKGDAARTKFADAISKVEETDKKNPDLRVSRAHDAILTDKLIHVDSNLQTALSKVGVEVKAQDVAPSSSPLRKYLNYLTNSDKQMHTLVSEIQGFNVTNQRLKPEQLLSLQIKINYIQQQIEFFTNILNKAVEGTKTIMNIQV